MNLLNCKITDMVALVRDRKISASELCRFYLDRIEKLNAELNAVLTVSPFALQRAGNIDAHFSRYKDLSLVGVPILLKDVFCAEKMKTTAGSKILKNFVAPYSAEVVQRLEKAGAVILGKCNQDEFAMGNSSENSAFGRALNPWNKMHVPGGSSGGSAVAVTAGLCAASIGTDTGGSVRQPSSFCNLVGVKPTYGRVSRYGMIAHASSLDQAGPITMYVEDSALILEMISGRDQKDSTSSEKMVPSWSGSRPPGKNNIKNLKIGRLNREYVEKSCSPEVIKVLERVAKFFQSHGAVVQDASIPLMTMSVPAYYLISTSEASSNLARYDGVRYGCRADFKSPCRLEEFYSRNRGTGFGDEVKRRIIMGTYCLSRGYYDEYYNKASQIRRRIRDQFVQLLSGFSVLIAPVSPSTAFKFGENPAGSLQSYLADSFTVSANLAGLPALSVPAGFSPVDGLPIGIQLIADHFDEQTLFDVALLIQNEMKVAGGRPDV